MPIYNIAVLIACHNRKVKTIQCIEALYAQHGVTIDYEIEIYLVDDASTDGTTDEIRVKFPNVHILYGDGNLFWNRGMHLAWQTAVAAKEYDYYLWLNDDTFLFENAIHILLQANSNNQIICGTTQSANNKNPTYGGYKRKSEIVLIPNGTFQECDHFNGNCVLIPHSIFILVGNLDQIFHHVIGDYDYGLRAKKLGVKNVVAPDYIGICEYTTTYQKWNSPKEKLITRINFLYSKHSGIYPIQYFHFDRRHNGIIVAIFHFFTIHLRTLIPSLWKDNSIY